MPEPAHLTKVENNISTRLSRLLRSKGLVLSGLATIGTVALKGFNIGATILDWAQRWEFARNPDKGPIKLLLWLLTPTGQSTLLVLAVTILILVILWVVNAPPRDVPVPKRTPAAATPPEITEPQKPKSRLTFDIDENESSASVRREGSHVSRITADLKVRCEKETDSTMVVRAFHLSLHRLETDGTMTVIPYQKEKQIIWKYSDGQFVPFNEGWTIDKPRSEYRHYSLTIEITPQAQAELSSDHFLQLKMDAIGQGEVSKAIYVKDWREDNSPISLKPFEILSPGAQKEVDRLKEKIRSYEKTNAELGRHNSEKEGQFKKRGEEIKNLKSQLSKLKDDLALAEEGHQAEITGLNIALNMKNDELDKAIGSIKEINERATMSTAENLRLQKELTSAAPNKRLIAIANNDAADIQEAVIVMGVYFRNEIENQKRYVDFWFQIFNLSVYDISIDDTLGEGDIIFNGDPLVGVKRVEDNKAINVPPRQPGTFTVRQFLDLGDINAIKAANGDRRFEFHNLRIKVKGGADFEHTVQDKRLKFNFGLSKDSPNYSYYNGPFVSRFNAAISGRINVLYFTRELDLVNTVPLKDDRYVFYLILHTYIANHGAPTGIDQFRLTIRVRNETFEGKRLPLTGCRWIRRGEEENLSEKDIELQNDVTFTDVRRGWLQFVVPGVKELEDESVFEAVLDVIDKNNDCNRLNPMSKARWIENSMENESYINGPELWQLH